MSVEITALLRQEADSRKQAEGELSGSALVILSAYRIHIVPHNELARIDGAGRRSFEMVVYGTFSVSSTDYTLRTKAPKSSYSARLWINHLKWGSDGARYEGRFGSSARLTL